MKRYKLPVTIMRSVEPDLDDREMYPEFDIYVTKAQIRKLARSKGAEKLHCYAKARRPK